MPGAGAVHHIKTGKVQSSICFPVYPQKRPKGESDLASATDIRQRGWHVGSVPGADIGSLFDHLVGELLKVHRHLDAERLGGLEVDYQLEARRLLDREVARISAL